MDDTDAVDSFFNKGAIGKFILLLGPWRNYNTTNNNGSSALTVAELKEILKGVLTDIRIPIVEEQYILKSADDVLTIPLIDDKGTNRHLTPREKYHFFTLRQKLHLLLAASRFCIIEDSTPSGAILEIGYAKNSGVVTILLRAKNDNEENSRYQKATWMTLDFEIHSKDTIVIHYSLGRLKDPLYQRRLVKCIVYHAEKRILERYQELCKIISKYSSHYSTNCSNVNLAKSNQLLEKYNKCKEIEQEHDKGD